MKTLTLALFLVGLGAGCSQPANNLRDPLVDMASAEDTGGSGTDMGGSSNTSTGPEDTGTTTDTGNGGDGGSIDMGGEVLDEVEPNDGTTLDEFNDLPVAAQIHGVIDTSDSDVFFVDAAPGTLYRVSLTLDAGSALQPHVAVFDAGRGGDPAGDDYVKIVRGEQIDFLGMGTGGYFVAVRDVRNVDGGAVGGQDFGYTLSVTGSDASAAASPLDFGTTLSGSLDGPGGVDLWAFDGTEGTDVRFDFAAAGDLDGRLYVYAASEGSWVARQDDRMLGDPNPLLDAPLFASGAMFLVVESIAEEAMSLGYTIDASLP